MRSCFKVLISLMLRFVVDIDYRIKTSLSSVAMFTINVELRPHLFSRRTDSPSECNIMKIITQKMCMNIYQEVQ